MTDRDDLDARLRSYGERWRSLLPEPAGVRPDTLELRARRARWLVPLVAAAVLAAIAGTVAFVDRGRDTQPPAETPTVVPWKPLPATHPTLPTRTVAPSPDAAGARPCTQDDLRHSTPQIGGAAGTLYLTVELSLVGPSPCRIEGRPDVVLLDHGRPLDLVVQPFRDNWFGKVRPVLVSTGHPAVVTVAWSASHSCPVVHNDRIRITLGSGFAPFTVAGFGTSDCTPGEAHVPVMVGAIAARDRATARVTSPYDHLSVTGSLDLTVDPGEAVRFTVTMTSPSDLSLVPCPDYRILTAAGERTWGLNCAGVPYRDADGNPYLPAGTPVRFAMQADSGDRSTPKFLWVLDGTRTPHDLAGVLTVAGDQLTGEIDGLLLRVGGPAPGVSEKTPDGKVRVVGGSVDRTVDVGPDGSFVVSGLSPGDYRLTGSTPQWNDGSWGCAADGLAHVQAGQATRADVICPMK